MCSFTYFLFSLWERLYSAFRASSPVCGGFLRDLGAQPAGAEMVERPVVSGAGAPQPPTCFAAKGSLRGLSPMARFLKSKSRSQLKRAMTA